MPQLTQGVDDDQGTVVYDDDQYSYDTMMFAVRSMAFTVLGDLNIGPFSAFKPKTRVLANVLCKYPPAPRAPGPGEVDNLQISTDAIYIFIVSIVLLNLLIGIIGENYSRWVVIM